MDSCSVRRGLGFNEALLQSVNGGMPLTLLAVVKSNFDTLVWLQLCNPQGVALFSFVRLPRHVSRPFSPALQCTACR